jgi:hypothetical protein
MQIERGIIR